MGIKTNNWNIIDYNGDDFMGICGIFITFIFHGSINNGNIIYIYINHY